MAIKVRERKLPGGGTHFQADIRIKLPDGTTHRERVKAPGRTHAAALRWARQRSHSLSGVMSSSNTVSFNGASKRWTTP